jgi:tetratricopeptide (TPR) repeat protein
VARYIRESKLERTPQIHFVATPVPNLLLDKKGLLRERLEIAEKTLGIQLAGNSIRYWPSAALIERLFVLDESFSEPGLAQDHNALCNKITDFNRNGLDFLLSQSEEAIRADDVELGAKLATVLATEFSNRSEAVFCRSRLARLGNGVGEAVQLAEQAFALDPVYEPPFEFLSAHYRRAKQFDRIEAMCEQLLRLSSRLPRDRKNRVLMSIGELRMSLGNYIQAAQHYKQLLEHALDDERRPPLLALVYQFNAAESARRAGQNVPLSTWEKIIHLFEGLPVLEGPPILAANRHEALYIPYALTGDIPKARDSLLKAKRIAETANDLETMFSVRDYRNVNRAEFRAINDDLNQATRADEGTAPRRLRSTTRTERKCVHQRGHPSKWSNHSIVHSCSLMGFPSGV